MFYKVESATDIEQVAALAREIWLEHYTPIIGVEQVEYMLETFHSAQRVAEQIEAEQYHYYFIQQAGINVGYIGVQRNEQQLFLSKIYVHSAYRGQGFAKQAMAFIQDLARGFALKRIELTVNRHNHGTIAAYQKMGFVKVAEQCSDIGQGYVMDDWVMALSL
ncbi:GNAT family N-acetyltransferase [Agarivorans sp. TSD2052]|uniref:GNAT family N-acetyltransferase n=1 Tax=Agarivorans sp. TSD2052 TaxID=2937286 RepID=UPI00200C7D30|nr:GNAT family N-acetyltransferase [Agarivorans sp. TSD2052]UPW17235.1 GNAT family N-acetyltransferase [Agarivorans sp. TSD2052]